MSKLILMFACLVSSVLFSVGCSIYDKDKGLRVCNIGFAILSVVVVFILAVM